MVKIIKKRLDVIVQELYQDITRSQAHAYIIRGYVTVNGQKSNKPGALISPNVPVTLHIPQERYVSRAGYKLAAALQTFNISLIGKVALDAGISTGGFSDCLLQNGIERIYGVDVGYGLVHERVKNNPKLILHERTNLRYLEPLPEQVDLVTLDLSFISVLKVIDIVAQALKPGGELIVLIKPQFEAGRELVGRGGIVSDPLVHAHVINTIRENLEEKGFSFQDCIPSPVLGASGNQEFLAYFKYTANQKL
jgi:23S rRNA (cytidine1920-2'-O)/16S rRNA (cytidine1409-2'-O)-methyltransferase